MTTRIAFIGAGQMARHHAAAIRRSGHAAQVVAVHDPSVDAAATFAGLTGAAAYATRDALLADARPDVVHVCTPPSQHFDAAFAAIEAGAHVYVEKPFTLSLAHAEQLLDQAARRTRLVCAGHQLLCDPAFTRLMKAAGRLGTPVQIDSHFAFRPMGQSIERTAAPALAEALTDVLPHPLYALVFMLEHFSTSPVEIAWAEATPTDLQAVLRAGDRVGRLSVSLRARPVASWITLMGTQGTLTCDFVRSMTVGIPNPGTEALEKLLTPMVDGAALVARTGVSAVRRVCSGTGYAGLAELIGAFHRAAMFNGPSPTSPAHLLTVTSLFERLAASVNTAAVGQRVQSPSTRRDIEAPLVAITGAAGFLGAEIARALPRVRGIGRKRSPAAGAAEWVTADLSRGLDPAALRGVDVVIHAAAETAGGFADHQRNTLDATQHLLEAMKQAAVFRLVLVSSLSVLRPPRGAWERQDEGTPRPTDSRRYGPYTWGKCEQEALVEDRARAFGIDVRIVRPGALLDPDAPDLPGLVGRRLFGAWHLGLGRPGLPIAVCDVASCAAAVAWCATHFDEAPRVVNLFDPRVRTRRELLSRLRTRGWTGRMVWVPISIVATGLSAAQGGLALLRGRWPGRLSAWSILRPRRFDGNLSAQLLTAAVGASVNEEPREAAAFS
jgi:predicted dehydrogenase/nucleoside-diphosphate-sugar epimerase